MTNTICTRCHVSIEADKLAEPNRCPDPACPTMPIIPGTFTHIDLEAPAVAATHPLAKAQAVMVGELARLAAPRLHVNPLPEEFEDVADYLLRGARIIDAWIKEVGLEVRSAAVTNIDMGPFTEQVVGALQGNAMFEIDRAAEALREERNEIEAAVRRGRHVGAAIDNVLRSMGLPPR